MKTARILVLGDIGCSPRMKNHCLSFAKSGWEVYFSGYLQSELPDNVTGNDNIHIDIIKESPPFINQRKKNKVFLILKVLFTSLYLFYFLLKCQWTNILLIQNPPAVPTFIVAWLISKFRGIKLLIDWHNYGYTLMDGNTEKSSLTKIYKRIEVDFSRRRLKAKHFCVSKAFANDLLLKWTIQADVLYDLPWQFTDEKNMELMHELILKLGQDFPVLIGDSSLGDSCTAITKRADDGTIVYRTNRPALVVSSCSWTIDDDFDTLFKALDRYNGFVETREGDLPDVICVITGKGPMKRYFQRIVSEQEWSHVSVVMPWLEIDDYPVMLSSADIGICLHNSTSGLDLPMKIVDMFSVGLPVVALNYKCLHELVHDRVNGRLFSSSDGLCDHLCELLPTIGSVDQSTSDISRYRDNIVNNSKHGLWHRHWEQVVLPVAVDLVAG